MPNFDLIRMKLNTKLTSDAVKDYFNFTVKQTEFVNSLYVQNKAMETKKRKSSEPLLSKNIQQSSKKSKKISASSNNEKNADNPGKQKPLKKLEMINRVILWCEQKSIDDFVYLTNLVDNDRFSFEQEAEVEPPRKKKKSCKETSVGDRKDNYNEKEHDESELKRSELERLERRYDRKQNQNNEALQKTLEKMDKRQTKSNEKRDAKTQEFMGQMVSEYKNLQKQQAADSKQAQQNQQAFMLQLLGKVQDIVAQVTPNNFQCQQIQNSNDYQLPGQGMLPAPVLTDVRCQNQIEYTQASVVAEQSDFEKSGPSKIIKNKNKIKKDPENDGKHQIKK